MASSSSKEKLNFQCVSEASLELIRLPLKDILLSQIRPEDLFLKIQSNSLLCGKNNLRPDQRKICYFPPPILPDYNKFDATLLYTLIRNLCTGLEPTRGWGHEPGQCDIQVGDDIERLRLFRNNTFAHLSSASIPDDTYEDVWKTLISVLVRLKSHSGCSVDYVQELREIKYSQFRYEIWERNIDIWKTYLEIKKQTDERAIRIIGDEEVICGNTAIFDTEVEQAESFCLPIIWQRRRGQSVEIIDPTLEKYSGSTNTRLVMSSVCKEDAWEYQACLSARNNHMLYSNTINLHVLGEIPFLNDLKVTTEDEGIVIHYSFGVSEKSPLVQDITWGKNGQPLDIKYDKFSGGTLCDSFLLIKSPSGDDKGEYYCTVTNAVGSKTKDIVLGVPCVAISIKPTVHFASDTSITSIVTSMPPPEKAQWQNSKNGNIFSELDVRKSKYFGSTVSPECPRLVIPKTTFDDNLYYRLQISNKLGVNVSNIVYLKVTGNLPNISISHETDINNRSIKLSGAVFLSDDSPGIKDVFWSKNGEMIDIQGSGGRLSGVTIDDPSLIIRDVSQEDVGKYQLTARNAIGTNTSDVISIDAPYLNIRSEKNGTEKNDCICFTVDIASIPSPCYAQWNAKSKEDETFTPLDVNAEEYEGSTNSLPHPMLVVIKKGQLEKNIYQIEVSNFVGSTVKEVLGDQSKPVQEREENKLYRTTDADAKFRFANLCNSLAMQFPPEKLKYLKKLIHDTEQVEDLESLLAANSAMDCFLILQNEKLFTRDDVIFMQYLCKQTQCGELYQKCKEYALNYKALCFIEIPPDNGYKEVQIHIQANLDWYNGKKIQKIVEIVAAMLECKEKDILVVDLRPSRSVILVLSIKEEYTWKFSALNEEDSQKLRRLNIDYLIVDKKTILLGKPCSVYRIHQCFKCPENTEFFCLSCNCDLCLLCKENHAKDQRTLNHNVVKYREIFNYIPKQKGNRRVKNECPLKLMSNPELLHSLRLTNIQGCFHISCVTPDQVWVNKSNNLTLTNTTGLTLHRLEDMCSELIFNGLYTVNNEGELIYIDVNYNINKLSKDMTKTTTFIKRDILWNPQCVYSSPSTGDLLVGMHGLGKRTNKVVRYSQSGQLTQTIHHGKKSLRHNCRHHYITENNNGDIVMSNLSVVVVKERGGKHRFTYKGPPSGSGLLPYGLCTDALSHILVCDGLTSSVQMINKDGQFVLYLLRKSLMLRTPYCLSYDNTTHRLWVGLLEESKVCVYSYIQRQDRAVDFYHAIENKEESFNKSQMTKEIELQTKVEQLLKMVSDPELIHSFTLTGFSTCAHISCATSDRIWVSYGNHLIFTNTTGVTLHRLEDLCNELYGGLHTVNNKGELIYIDRNYSVNKLSKDMKTTTAFIEETNFLWKPKCVYSSPSTGDLLVGMQRQGTKISKVSRYNKSRQLTQTIQYDNKGLDLYRTIRYISENINGDVVVSICDAVVVTERGGRHRFSYTGHPSGSELWPFSICTDALSHILVCDGLTSTVQMIDKDGQFLFCLLNNSLGIRTPHCLSYDLNSHHLWVGSLKENKVCVYRYIQRQDRTEDFCHATDNEESLNKIQMTKIVQPQAYIKQLRMFRPKFLYRLILTELRGCDHISCVTSDLIWVSKMNNLILMNTQDVTLHRIEGLGSEFGSHTVTRENELIYIDMNDNINKLSNDMKTTTIVIERTVCSWKPRCVYYSPITGDLLIGMHSIDKKSGKVARYNRDGQLIQTIQHNNKGLDLYRTPCYITENNNGDVVVSDYESCAIVVTERGGILRFSYTGHPSGSELWPFAICTDALSHILVCDGLTSTVQMIDKDGQFLFCLLKNPLGICTPHCLSYDLNSHHLWIGSLKEEKVCVYRYIQRQDRRQDLCHVTDYEESLNKIQMTKLEKPQRQNSLDITDYALESLSEMQKMAKKPRKFRLKGGLKK